MVGVWFSAARRQDFVAAYRLPEGVGHGLSTAYPTIKESPDASGAASASSVNGRAG